MIADLRLKPVLGASASGLLACAIGIPARTVRTVFSTPKDRHFYGHGVFDPAGRLLYATENNVATGRGLIGIYDADEGYRRVGELPSHGIGPHDLRLLSDGTTLVVANGGIESHPEMPRAALNIPEMAPSLVYLDRRDGQLLAETRLAPSLHLLSIRHLAVDRSDRVVFAMQYQGAPGDEVPLIGVCMRGGTVRLFDEPTRALRRMRQYCGSVAFDCAGRVVAATSPRGNVAVLWNIDSPELPEAVGIADVCGVTATAAPGQFLMSSGHGGVFRVGAGATQPVPVPSPFLEGGM